jgi:hypothetical protein
VYYGDVPVEANLDFVEMVGGELGRVGAKILDSIRFGIMASVNHSNQVIGQDAFEDAHVVLEILRPPNR